MLKQTIRQDLLEGGSGESHGGLQEGGAEDGTNRGIRSRGEDIYVDGTDFVTGKSPNGIKTS
ncbi:hypothetical protein [Bacillus methanolicus]|uniref:hypothetical protein n=2 Tax=Bacillus methanolicus TaxID=1471 RepID=UPI00025F1AF5|nr:hypothetical protein [Bacillus methanolicus]EIJ79372.1 hypothetical protein MGA3_13491 [Bacillus methanolicus MGA3]EIJ79760.1 hypothetical protein MGA3_15451 [Bacillus methanolicus MGA3]EIJ80862.1 hypothetical protein MGA3_11195 [Bacillus methanolicus MGA3]EIJ83292.1 hypothetical protein MGA3_08720 [Bacillus methanolicus MGA3]EIJ83319.1 hypothetical protein MGA3_08865 [Bacillus methanolicus MGA3]